MGTDELVLNDWAAGGNTLEHYVFAARETDDDALRSDYVRLARESLKDNPTLWNYGYAIARLGGVLGPEVVSELGKEMVEKYPLLGRIHFIPKVIAHAEYAQR